MHEKIKMRLDEMPYRDIESGKKRFEVRLNDEKRQALQVGDVIEFTLRPDFVETFEKKIVGLHKYDTFADFYSEHPKEKGEVTAYDFYTKDDEEMYGALAIELA